MLVKKTKKGKFSFTLQFPERENLYVRLISFLETESAILPFIPLKNEAVAHRIMIYSVLDELFRKHFDKMLSPELLVKFTFTQVEAIAMVIFLRDCTGDLQLQELKSGLHKNLC